MRIERIYIACYRKDLRLLQCCVASIRQWYPDIPISLLRDESDGPFDTGALERHWGVEIFPTERRLLGYGFGKLEPLFLERRERCLLLDADTVFIGRVLDRFESWDDDFVVDAFSSEPTDRVHIICFDLAKLAEIEPEFEYPGFNFNTGQIVATTGILKREDFEPHVDFSWIPSVRRDEVFKCGEQGVLNYVLLRKHVEGALTLRRDDFMRWPSGLTPEDVRVDLLTQDSPYPWVLHWFGVSKEGFLGDMAMGHLLNHFEALYYTRTPATRSERVRIAAERLLASREGRKLGDRG